MHAAGCTPVKAVAILQSNGIPASHPFIYLPSIDRSDQASGADVNRPAWAEDGDSRNSGNRNWCEAAIRRRESPYLISCGGSDAAIRQYPCHVETVDFPCLGTRHFSGMTLMILPLLSLIRTSLQQRSELALEYLALRQRLAVLNRRRRRPRLRKFGRLLWVLSVDKT